MTILIERFNMTKMIEFRWIKLNYYYYTLLLLHFMIISILSHDLYHQWLINSFMQRKITEEADQLIA